MQFHLESCETDVKLSSISKAGYLAFANAEFNVIVLQSSLIKPLKFFALLKIRIFIKRFSLSVNVILFSFKTKKPIVKFPL